MQQGQQLQGALQDRIVWVAASTHDGEEELILQAHQLLLKQYPEALLILVPRHPERASAVAKMIAACNMRMQKRSDCQFPDSEDYHWGFTLNADNSFTAGNATLQVVVLDIDGLRGVGDFEIEIAFGLPKVINQSGDVHEGEFGDLEAYLLDSDGHQGTFCTFIIIDSNGTTVMESDGPLPNDGVFSTRWMPPTFGAPFASTIGCTDAQGNQIAHTREEIYPIPSSKSNDTNNTDVLNEDPTSNSKISKLMVAILLAVFLITIIVTSLLVLLKNSNQNEYGDMSEKLDQSSEWSAPSDSRVEGEQNLAFAEMAMGELDEVSTNEQDMSDVEEILQDEEEIDITLDDEVNSDGAMVIEFSDDTSLDETNES